MKRYLAILAIVASLLVGCSAPASNGPAHADAWTSFNAETLPADVVSEGFKAEYVGAYTADTLPDSLVGMPSKDDSDVIYGFKIEVL